MGISDSLTGEGSWLYSVEISTPRNMRKKKEGKGGKGDPSGAHSPPPRSWESPGDASGIHGQGGESGGHHRGTQGRSCRPTPPTPTHRRATDPARRAKHNTNPSRSPKPPRSPTRSAQYTDWLSKPRSEECWCVCREPPVDQPELLFQELQSPVDRRDVDPKRRACRGSRRRALPRRAVHPALPDPGNQSAVGSWSPTTRRVLKDAVSIGTLRAVRTQSTSRRSS